MNISIWGGFQICINVPYAFTEAKITSFFGRWESEFNILLHLKKTGSLNMCNGTEKRLEKDHSAHGVNTNYLWPVV